MKTIKDIEEILDSVKIPSDEEIEAAGLRFDRRLRRMRVRRRMIWAMSSSAAVLLCGVIFALLWMNGEEKNGIEGTKVSNIVKMEKSVMEPTLVLQDGHQLNLKAGKVDSTILNSNIQIADNHITYDTASVIREIVYNTLVIPAGYTYDVTLADGTKVTLNAGSHLKYPVEFIGDKREVELSGEAYFEVTKSGKPFEVNVSGSKIRVYGTQFNVKSTRGKRLETVLVEGKIGFKSPDRDEIQVVPGELVAYNPASGTIKVETVDVQYATAWRNGVFKYQDRKLDLVLEDIAVWYGIEFDSHVDLTTIELTMNLSKSTPVEEVISFLELMTDFKFIKERGHYIVRK